MADDTSTGDERFAPGSGETTKRLSLFRPYAQTVHTGIEFIQMSRLVQASLFQRSQPSSLCTAGRIKRCAENRRQYFWHQKSLRVTVQVW
ncbi:hypothetical protein ACNKHT_27150 [Shigella flexneri]